MIEIPYPIPQLALTSWLMLTAVKHIFKNGKGRTPVNFYLVSTEFLFELALLVAGGFFALGLRWPHLLWAGLAGIGLVGAAITHNRPRPAYNAVSAMVASLICFVIYYAGGLYGHY